MCDEAMCELMCEIGKTMCAVSWNGLS